MACKALCSAFSVSILPFFLACSNSCRLVLMNVNQWSAHSQVGLDLFELFRCQSRQSINPFSFLPQGGRPPPLVTKSSFPSASRRKSIAWQSCPYSGDLTILQSHKQHILSGLVESTPRQHHTGPRGFTSRTNDRK